VTAIVGGAVPNRTNFTVGGHPGNASTGSGWCGYDAHKGFLTAYTMPGVDHLLLDLTDALDKNGSVRFVVTAMTIAGTYTDGAGYFNEFASPMEETVDTLYEFRLGADNISVDVFRPQLEIRTTDKQWVAALKRGTGSGRFESFGTYRCARRQPPGAFFSPGAMMSPHVMNLMGGTQPANQPGGNLSSLVTGPVMPGPMPFMSLAMEPNNTAEPQRIIVNGGNLIRKGFFVAPKVKTATSYRLLSVRAYPNNVDVAAEYIMENGLPVAIGFSILRLPAKVMPIRKADDRALFFTTDYRDLGDHMPSPGELPEESISRKVSTIWRYNLATLPYNQIRIHVDPTVPKRWRPWFKRGVELWNEAFSKIGKPMGVRAMVPEDKDWPADYDISDARFSTISWTISSAVVSMGIAKVDPRSGEILKSDIVMSDGWVRAWLGDLDLLAPNFTHQLDQAKGYRFETASDATVMLNRRPIPGRLKFGDWGRKLSLLASATGQPLLPQQREEVLGKGLMHVVAHETGHILGLRHNFKGSLGVSYACTRDPDCSAVHGLTASVMDYIPINMPSKDAPDVHLFSPVLGAYDKLAIQYGYMNANEKDMQVVLRDAEAYETCYDNDRILRQDPACAAYDMSSDPIKYQEDQMGRLAEVQQNLLNTSVMPGAPFTHYGEAVDTVLAMAESSGLKLMDWLGGVSNAYAHRNSDGTLPSRVARQPVPASAQRRALNLILRLLRLEKAGLMPPREALPYLVAGSDVQGKVETLDLGLRVSKISKTLIERIFHEKTLAKIVAQERLGEDDRQEAPKPGAAELSQRIVSSNAAETVPTKEKALDGPEEPGYEIDRTRLMKSAKRARHDRRELGPFTTGELLATVVSQVVGKAALGSAPRSDWDLHGLLISGLADTYQNSALPNEVNAHALHHLQRLHTEVKGSLMELRASPKSSEQGMPAEDDLVRAHLVGLRQKITSALCQGQSQDRCEALTNNAVSNSSPLLMSIVVLAAARFLL